VKATDKVKVNVIDVRCGNKDQKVMVCHKGKTLCISLRGAVAHLHHGDALGSCPVLSSITDNTKRSDAGAAKKVSKELKIFNAPNPFSQSTRIYYELPFNGNVLIKIYDAVGREVATVVKGERKAGSYNSNFSAAGLAKGLYYYQLTYTTEKQQVLVKTGKMIVVK
jgi:hypothetical protein